MRFLLRHKGFIAPPLVLVVLVVLLVVLGGNGGAERFYPRF